MNENTTKPTKKKRLLFWLTLAACLLIVAAITVGIVFAVKGNGGNLTIDNDPPAQGDDGKTDDDSQATLPPADEGDTGNGDDIVDTSSMYEFITPIEHVNLIKSHEFNWDNTMGWYKLHQAIDFGADAGTNVLAAVDGTVTSIVTSDILDYAVIKIAHANDVTTVYKFVEPAEGLQVGQKVNRGQVIGTVAAASGNENADGDHLHFEVYSHGEIVDPEIYLNLNSK